MRFQNIFDVTSNTLAVVEANGLNIAWIEPRDANVTHLRLSINYFSNRQYDSAGIASSWHTRRSHVRLVDGAVKFLPEDMDTGLLKTLTTTGGEEKDTGILKDAGMSVPLNH
jgi:hypothetical protein